jgi:hypothetical protein
MKALRNFLLDPHWLRNNTRSLIKAIGVGNYEQRYWWGAVERPHYAYCVYNAAQLAKKLGYPRISILEFGVAGGNGLVNFEYHAEEISKLTSVEIEIYGFDTGEGLPEPIDYRDLPYQWEGGFFKMDIPKLKSRLKKAKLVFGDVRETSKDFFEKYDPAPIGAISFDLDFYSSTNAALSMLEADEKYFLPRIFCYFDDTIGAETELYNDFIGQRLSINEFNQTHDHIKLGLPYYLLAREVVEPWFHQIWIGHLFNHRHYTKFVADQNQQLPIS